MTTATGTQNRRKELFGQGLKECADCHVVKTLDEFSRIARNVGLGTSHYTAACHPCRLLRNRKYRAENPARVRSMARLAHVARTYGLTAEQYNAMYEQQRGCCAICAIHASEMKYALAVDHDHETDRVRGLLCRKCNAAIGFFKEDAATLQSAIDYLSRHSGMV